MDSIIIFNFRSELVLNNYTMDSDQDTEAEDRENEKDRNANRLSESFGEFNKVWLVFASVPIEN